VRFRPTAHVKADWPARRPAGTAVSDGHPSSPGAGCLPRGVGQRCAGWGDL